MTIIIYSSKTGSSEKYAKMLADRTGLPCYSIKDAYPKDEDIVFFGWLRKYTVNGLSKVDRSRLKAVCVVGVDNTDFFPRAEVIKNNGYNAETFYLRGWIDIKKINFFERMILKLVAKHILKEAGVYADMDLIKTMTEGGSYFDESFIEPIEKFIECSE